MRFSRVPALFPLVLLLVVGVLLFLSPPGAGVELLLLPAPALPLGESTAPLLVTTLAAVVGNA